MGKLHHIIEAQQFDRRALQEIFLSVDKMADWMVQEDMWMKKEAQVSLSAEEKKERQRSRLEMQRGVKGKRMFSVFYQSSTRTRASFETAMKILGGEVAVSFSSEQEFSNTARKKALEDTVRGLGLLFPHVIVLRHPHAGAAERAKEVSSGVPIINAGDGPNQHPTQAIADLYTIRNLFKQIDGLSIAFVGNLFSSREIRSLCYLLAEYDVDIYAVSPDMLKLRQDVRDCLNKAAGVRLFEVDNLEEIVGKVKVLYQARIPGKASGGDTFVVEDQMFSYREIKKRYTINDQVLKKLLKGSIVMDLSFRPEDSLDLKNVPLVCYTQIQNGLFVRMALLKMILDSI